MGVCMTRCYAEARRLSCWKPSTNVEDREHLVDFDMFLDEEARPRPVSISSWLSCVRSQTLILSFSMPQLDDNGLSCSDVSLLHDSDVGSQNSDIIYEFGINNEEMELQEETNIDASKEALKLKNIAENSTELMNPAQLAQENNLTLPIKQKYGASQEHSKGREKGADGQSSICSEPSTPELEWENEDGLSPVTRLPDNNDISSDTASCVSQLSTPMSNGNEELEWDGHFTSTQISQLDLETERLISEIERLTSGVLQGQASNAS